MGFYNPSGCTEAEKTYLGLALHQVRRWRDWYEYEELASTAILGAFEAVAEYRGQPRRLPAVAVVGARSAVKNYWRARGRLKRTADVVSLDELAELELSPTAPDFLPALMEEMDWANTLRQCCTEEQQRYLYRFYYLGESYKEIAQAEGVPRKRVDNKIYEGLRRLRATLGPRETT
jgi:RNA polymerase sigma factor (sigma-70 family)